MIPPIAELMAAIANVEVERRSDELARQALTPGQYAQWRAERDKEKREARERADVERRHRELCDAIRSTSFWRMGR